MTIMIIIKCCYQIINGNDNFVYFIDSTCLRIWSNRHSIKAISNKLKSYPGEVYTKANSEKCPVMFNRKYSGDVLFIANEGYILEPNFFSNPRQSVKAMHGYGLDKTDSLDALFVSNKRVNSRERIDVIDISPMTLKILDIQIPEEWEGQV